MEVEKIPQDELEKIKENYKQGGYTLLAESIEHFLIRNIEKIPKFKQTVESKFEVPLSLEDVIRLFIFNSKTVNLQLDAQDQKEEIEKEKYIRHEHGSIESDGEIEMSWVNKYAGGWRIHRVRETLYVFGMEKEKYMDMVCNLMKEKDFHQSGNKI